jgi:hypothetical protein
LVAYSMAGLEVDLIDSVDRHEAHGGARQRLGDGFGIDGVVLVRLDVRFDELRWNDSDVLAEGGELARYPVSARAGFHTDTRCRSGGKELNESFAGELCSLDGLASGIEPDHVKNRFSQADTVGHGAFRLVPYDVAPHRVETSASPVSGAGIPIRAGHRSAAPVQSGEDSTC